MQELYAPALALAAVGAMARLPAAAYAWVRTFQARERLRSFRFGWVEFLTTCEPLVLLVLAYPLFQSIGAIWAPTHRQILVATLGATLVLIGWAFQVWAFLSWKSLFAGHGVLDEQRILRRGAYAAVRHPAYSGVCLVWLGLGVAFASPLALATCALYAVPIYILYIRAEESMMLESFGDEYRDYCRRVPMLVPRLRGERRGSPVERRG